MLLDAFTFQTRSGWSVNPLPALDSENTLVIVFGAPELAKRRTPSLIWPSAYPRSHIVGCSTAGEIFGTALADKSLSVAVARFDGRQSRRHRLRPAWSPRTIVRRRANPSPASSTTQRCAGSCCSRTALNVNGSELVRGLNSVLPAHVVVTGGLAGDGISLPAHLGGPGRPAAHQHASCAAGLYGERLRIGHGSKGGWDNFGPERLVTRSRGQRARSSLTVARRSSCTRNTWASWPADYPRPACSSRWRCAPTPPTTRAWCGPSWRSTKRAQSMTFAGDMPEGALARLMRANFDRLIDGASEAAALAGAAHRRATRARRWPSRSAASAGAWCSANAPKRRSRRPSRSCPAGTRQIGFYSYGEISPYALGPCDLHNQTMTLTTIARAAACLSRRSHPGHPPLAPHAPTPRSASSRRRGVRDPDGSAQMLRAGCGSSARVSQSYTEADQERYLLERSLNVSSREMQDLSGRLAAERDRLTAILNSLGDGLCALDSDGRLLFMNPQGERLLGWPEHELVGRDLLAMVGASAPARPRATARAQPSRCATWSAAARPYRNDDARFVRKDGSVLPVSYALAPLMTQGRLSGAVLVFRDMTDAQAAAIRRRRSSSGATRCCAWRGAWPPSPTPNGSHRPARRSRGRAGLATTAR